MYVLLEYLADLAQIFITYGWAPFPMHIQLMPFNISCGGWFKKETVFQLNIPFQKLGSVLHKTPYYS